MKKLKILAILLVAFLMIPFGVLAEGEDEATKEGARETTEETADSKEVPIYFFRGEGCSHCAEAEEWFKSIEGEYGSYFVIKDYETWYDTDNADLMQQVAKSRGEEAEGVPYIIVGNKSWNGFAEEYKEEILSEIKNVFEQDVKDRYDIMQLLGTNAKDAKESNSGDFVALVLIVLVVGGIGFGVYKARQTTN